MPPFIVVIVSRPPPYLLKNSLVAAAYFGIAVRSTHYPLNPGVCFFCISEKARWFMASRQQNCGS
jgi:hypothetical protein